MSGYTGKYQPVGVVHRGEHLRPDGNGGIVHECKDGELIYHYEPLAELLAGLEEGND